MAVIGATQLEPVNVLGSFVGGLEAGRTAAAQRQKEAEALRLQRQQEAVNALIGTGALETAEGRNALARMPGGFEVLKGYGESQESLGKGMEAQTKGLSDRLQLWKRMLPADPVSAARWVQSAYADPIVGPELAKFGTREEVIAGIPSDPANYMKWAEGVSMFADEYAKRRVPTAEAMLPYTQPKSPEVLAQEVMKARAGAPTTVIGGTGKFGEAVAKGGGEEIVESRNQASAALASINNIQSLLPLVSSPEFISGTLGDARLAVAKALNLPGATETQVYFSGIGRDVAEIIKAFGAGTGLSDADREFAKGIAGGDIKLTGPAIRKILWLNANYNNERIKRYNQRVSEIASNPMTDEATRQQLAVLHAPIQAVDVGPRPVMSKDEAKLLPPGTSFVMPDGAVYRVPAKKK
jgi:pimeloyl-ACP methyl ester carboxylesterase